MTINVPRAVTTIFDRFQKTNQEIFLVGGAVRDIIMGRPVTDWDFTTNAPPEEILSLFPGQSFYNNRFGTVSVLIDKKSTGVLEITTYRRESDYADKRHPDKVSWGKTITEDLSRRDFTINAIAATIDKKTKKGISLVITDPHHGQRDIDRKVIRTVGNPDERFSEDALRMLRAFRIASQIGFSLEPKTMASIKKNAPLLADIAWERIRDEFFKLVISPFAAEQFEPLYQSKVLDYVLPELVAGYGVAQAKHHTEDVWNHSLKSMHFCPSDDPVVKLACLLHDIGKPVTAQGEGEKRTFYNHEIVGAKLAYNIGKRWRLSKDQLTKLSKLVRWHQFSVNEQQTDKALRRFIRHVSKENLNAILAVRIGDRLGGGARETSWRLELFKKRLSEVQKLPFTVQDLKVNGHDVMTLLNLTPGPKIGQILNALFAEVEEDKNKNNREWLLNRIAEIGTVSN